MDYGVHDDAKTSDELKHYVEFKSGDTWTVESNGDIGDLGRLAPLFVRCNGIECDLRVSAIGAFFKTFDEIRVSYHPTRGTTVECCVVPVTRATRLLAQIGDAINDYKTEIDDAISAFLQSDFMEGDE